MSSSSSMKCYQLPPTLTSSVPPCPIPPHQSTLFQPPWPAHPGSKSPGTFLPQGLCTNCSSVWKPDLDTVLFTPGEASIQNMVYKINWYSERGNCFICHVNYGISYLLFVLFIPCILESYCHEDAVLQNIPNSRTYGHKHLYSSSQTCRPIEICLG